MWQIRIRKIVLKLSAELLKLDSNISSAIDVGCGNGDFTIKIAKRFSQLTHIWGCDFVLDALDIARETQPLDKIIIFKEANILKIPFEENKFGLTICINVLHHIYKSDLSRALSELARVTARYLILEIKNGNNFYYKHIHPKSFGGMRVYPTTACKVDSILRDHGFHSIQQKGIFYFNWLSPLLVLVFEKVLPNDSGPKSG